MTVYAFTPEHWKKIYSSFQGKKRLHLKNERSLQLFFEAIFYIADNGNKWRLLPERYGKWNSIHRRFKRWADRGVFKNLLQSISIPDHSKVMIDSTIVRAHAKAAGHRKNGNSVAALGRSCGGFSSKIHMLADAVGRPIDFIVTPGQEHDITQAENLTKIIKKNQHYWLIKAMIAPHL